MSGRFNSYGFSRYSSRLRDSDTKDECNDCNCLNPTYPFYRDWTKALFSLYFEDFDFYAYEDVEVEDIPISNSFADVWAFITSQDGVKYGTCKYGETRNADGDPAMDINADFKTKDQLHQVYRLDPSGKEYTVPVNVNDPDDPIDTSSNPAGEFYSLVWPFPAATVGLWHDSNMTFAFWINDTLEIVIGNQTDTYRKINIPEGARLTWGWMSSSEESSSDSGDVIFSFGFLRADDAGDLFVQDIDNNRLY